MYVTCNFERIPWTKVEDITELKHDDDDDKYTAKSSNFTIKLIKKK